MKLASSKAKRVLGCLVAGVLSQIACLPAFATLGEDVATVENDRVQMKAQVRTTTSAAGYAVHVIQSSTGTTVREYVSASGKVFAVAWDGPLLPDFRQTLGQYFDDYNSGASAPHVGRRHLTIQRADLVVHSNGHMRAFYGNAYVPSLLPPNFSVGDIK